MAVKAKEFIAVRDMPRTTVRAHPTLFERLELYRRREGLRSLNDAIVMLVEGGLKAAKL